MRYGPMKSAFVLTFSIGLFFCLCPIVERPVSAQTAKARSNAADATATGQLERQGDGTFLAKFDLGKLPAGLNASIDLKIKNPFDQQINFTGVSKACKCSNFQPDRQYVAANDELAARVRLKLPTRRNSNKGQTTMVIVNDSVPIVELFFDYELEGLLAFTELLGIVGFDSDNQTRVYEIPFLATAPVDMTKLEIKSTENLNGCKFEILNQNERGVVKVTMSDSILTKSKIRGEVTIQEQGTKRLDTFYLTIKNDKLAEISPAVMAFKKEDGKFVATATLKMAKSVVDDDALKNIQLFCQFGETKIKTQMKRISDKLISVVLIAEVELAAVNTAENTSLQWKVVQDGATTNLKTPFVVSE